MPELALNEKKILLLICVRINQLDGQLDLNYELDEIMLKESSKKNGNERPPEKNLRKANTLLGIRGNCSYKSESSS